MGIEYSSEQHQELPVTGAPRSLEVLRTGMVSGSFVRKDGAVVRLRENGRNYWVVDRRGEQQFQLVDTGLQDNSIKLLDTKGRTVAGARKERFGPGKLANITIKNGNLLKKSEGRVLSAATLHHSPAQAGNSCQIYIHNVSLRESLTSCVANLY